MAESTKIAWTHSTFNPWIGCTKVSPGCDHCYAEAQDARGRWDGGKEHWGAGVQRYRTSEANWRKVASWNRSATIMQIQPWLVFCASLADVFDNEVPDEWREDLFGLIASTPALTWLLLTKRIGNATRWLPWVRSGSNQPWPNVWLGASIVNQEEADRDIPKLLATPAAKRFVSYEPALGPVNLGPYLSRDHLFRLLPGFRDPMGGLNWVIIGGESGPRARPFDIAWARSTVTQCKAAGVACFVKQLGAKPEWNDPEPDLSEPPYWMPIKLRDRAGADPSEWPADLRVQEWPI